MSYYIITLSPSVPINRALDILIDQLNNDKDDLMKRTTLCLNNIYKLAELAGFKSKKQSREFQKILSKQNKQIQFAIEDKNGENFLNFLDIK